MEIQFTLYVIRAAFISHIKFSSLMMEQTPVFRTNSQHVDANVLRSCVSRTKSSFKSQRIRSFGPARLRDFSSGEKAISRSLIKQRIGKFMGFEYVAGEIGTSGRMSSIRDRSLYSNRKRLKGILGIWRILTAFWFIFGNFNFPPLVN